MDHTGTGPITVFLADDNLIVREGVRALIQRHRDLTVVGVAGDYDGVIGGAAATSPQVLVTDIRMPPSFQREGIDAAKEVRHRHPGTGVVVLSQYEDPEYAVSLLAEGSAGYGYLLKDHVAEGNQLVDAIRAVATGGTALDPAIVEALVRPVLAPGGLAPAEEELLGMIAEGKPIKAIAAARRITPEAVDAEVEAVFVKLAEGVSAGNASALRRLRMLHQAIVDREEQGETLSRLLPSGLADKLRHERQAIGETERVVVTVLMSDIRSYSTIAEHADPSQLAGQLNTHRAAMNRAILGEGGTVMQFVGDAVMAVFGAPFPQPDHADRAVAAACVMHELQREINVRWAADGLPAFGLGLGLSTGEAAAALLGSAERLEYTLVGDTVNLSQRLQQFADAGETVLSGATLRGPEHATAGHLAGSADGQGPGHPGHRIQDHSAGGRPGRRSRPGRRPAGGPAGRRGPDNPNGGVMTEDSPALVMRGVRKTFEAENAPVRALRGVDLCVSRGEFTALMGPSGCGKSTLLNLVAGLDTADEGEISVAGEAVTGRGEDDLARLRRRHIGLVFQFFNLLEGMTVLENVALPAVIAGRRRKMAETRARDLLDLLGISDKASALPGVLSGGQRQRLAIARALANEPTLLLADEPTGALDSEGGEEIIELLRRLHAGGQTIIMVTHDASVAAAAGRVIRMRDGRIEEPERQPGSRGPVIIEAR